VTSDEQRSDQPSVVSDQPNAVTSDEQKAGDRFWRLPVKSQIADSKFKSKTTTVQGRVKSKEAISRQWSVISQMQ
jgi:hypothetical protein